MEKPQIVYWVDEGQDASRANTVFVDCEFADVYYQEHEFADPGNGGIVVFRATEGGLLEVQLSEKKAQRLWKSLTEALGTAEHEHDAWCPE